MTKFKNICIVDYECGNIFTINKALSRHGCNVKITNDYKEIIEANKIKHNPPTKNETKAETTGLLMCLASSTLTPT